MQWMLVYHLGVSAFLLLVTINIGLNWRIFVAPRARPAETWNRRAPLVSVLVPARNEASRIAPCLRSLLDQDYPDFEFIVVDDHSTDDTAAVVLAHGFSRESGGRARLIAGRPLPAGWTGKSWACHQLAAEARGEYLLFTDADTAHDLAALRALVGHALETDAALLSAWPRQVTASWSEHAVIPLVYVLLLGALPHYLLRRLQRHPSYARGASAASLRTLGAANGQCMLFRRSSYDAIGGHAAVRDHLVEDVALGRLVAERTAAGMRLINCDGSRLITCRMYRTFREVWEGFTKNLRAAFAQSAAAFWLFGLVQFTGLFLPFVFACLPWLSGRWWWLALAQAAWILLIRAALAVRYRTSWWGVCLHPVGQALSLLIGLNSWRLSARGGVTWKGRTYRMSPSAADDHIERPAASAASQELP